MARGSRIEYQEGEQVGRLKFVRDDGYKLASRGDKLRMGIFICFFCKSEFRAMINNVKSGQQCSCGCARGKPGVVGTTNQRRRRSMFFSKNRQVAEW